MTGDGGGEAKSLDQLRGRLAAIDRRILELVRERQGFAGEIGRLKQQTGLPTRDYAQETEVLSRAANHARDLGLSPGLAERLMLELIKGSLTVQERDQLGGRARGDDRPVLVIGGSGRMGGWFARFLASQGYRVEVADPEKPAAGFRHLADWRASPLDHDLIVVAAPLRATRDILAALAERRPAGLVFDVASLKSPLRDALRALAAAGVRVTSVHPMFGPDAELLSGRHVVFVDVGMPEATRAARELFAPTAAQQIEMDLDSHDRLVAYVLGLSHAVNIAFFTALAESGETAERLEALASTTFTAQIQVARKVARENPRLYYEIQALNDYGAGALDELSRAVARLRDCVGAADEAGFVEMMSRGEGYLAGAVSRES